MNENENESVHENQTPPVEEPEERIPPDFSRFVAIDIETTGLNPEIGEIIELGAVRYENGEETGEFHTLVKPLKGYPERNRRLTGIDPELLKTASEVSGALRELQSFVEDDILVSHNARFDTTFLKTHFEKNDIEPLTNPALCTLHLAALVDPEADSLQLGALAKLWEIEVVDPHRAVLDARLAGQLVLKIFDEIRSWKTAFVKHLTGYRGKSLDSIFDFLDWIAGDAEPDPEWRLDFAIRECLLDRSDRHSLQPFPDLLTDPPDSPERDIELENEVREAFERGGVTMFEDLRPGVSSASRNIPIGAEGFPGFVVTVPDETARRLAVGPDGGTDGLGGPDGTFYLGRLFEYLCLARSFAEDGRPAGWLELSPYERIVYARWLAGTKTGRVGRVNWWLLNNFSGLKGHLNSLSEGRIGCLGPEVPHPMPCYVKLAMEVATKAGRVVVDHKYPFSQIGDQCHEECSLCEVPALLIEGADRLDDGARSTESRIIEIEPFTRKVTSFVKAAESMAVSVQEGVETAESALKEILEVSRSTLRAFRESGKIEFAGPLHIDEETWTDEIFSELAGALEAAADLLAVSVYKLKNTENLSDEYRTLCEALEHVMVSVKMLRHTPPGWSASLEGAPLRSPRRVTYRLTPVDVRDSIRGLVNHAKGGIFATGRHLRHGGTFDRIKSTWGMDDGFQVEERILEDPSVAVPELYLPEDVMPPSGRSGRKHHWHKYMERTSNLLKMLAETIGGRTVAAFSAHHELRKVRELLEKSPPRDCVILAQYHDGTKSAIIQEYLNNPATLLLGGRNLLDGVDLRPAGFTVLVIVKLPFTSPEEPLHRAALRLAESEGLDGLRSHLVPLAVEITNRWIDSLLAGPIPVGSEPGRPAGAIVMLDPRALYNEWGEDFLGALTSRPAHRMSFREMLATLKEQANAYVGEQSETSARRGH